MAPTDLTFKIIVSIALSVLLLVFPLIIEVDLSCRLTICSDCKFPGSLLLEFFLASKLLEVNLTALTGGVIELCFLIVHILANAVSLIFKFIGSNFLVSWRSVTPTIQSMGIFSSIITPILIFVFSLHLIAVEWIKVI